MYGTGSGPRVEAAHPLHAAKRLGFGVWGLGFGV